MSNEFANMVDKRNIFMLLGCYCNNPKLVVEEKTKTNMNDYPEDFHKYIFGAINNLARKGYSKITSAEIEGEMSPFNNCMEIWKKNNGVEYIEEAIEHTQDKLLNAEMYRENVRKYSIIRTAKQELRLDISFIYDEEDLNKMTIFNNFSSKDVLKLINERLTSYKDMWLDDFSNERKYSAGDGVDELLEKFQKQEDTYGFTFQNAYLNTIFRGTRNSKLYVFSSKSGGGKSRGMIGEISNVTHDKMYNWNTRKWIDLGESRPGLYLSTELIQEEIESAVLAHISGVDQGRIETWDLNEEEIEIVKQSAEVMKNGKLKIVEIPQFSISKIHDLVESYIINEEIEVVYFDYINECSELSAESYAKNRANLRTDQILYNFSMELKNICNKYGIPLRTATQLSSNYKDEKDANSIKGSKSIIEKADVGCICLPVTEEDLKKLKPILSKGFFEKPNFATFIYKNRGGKFKDVIVWSKFSMGTCREEGLFVTGYDYKLITNIQPTIINVDFKGTVNSADLIMIEDEEDSTVEETISEFKKAK